MSGYVRIHRSLIGHPAFRNDAEAMAFAWMVAKAAWKPVRVRYKGKGLQLNRGQLAVSQRDMAHDLDRDKAWIERLWKRLKGEAMIKVEVEAGVAVITICNYANYQRSEDRREAANEAPREADARQTQGTEQGSEEVKEGKEPNGSYRAWLCPDGVDKQVWDDFLKNRKRKRLPNTATAWKGFLDDLARVSLETGIPPPRLIERVTAKGWGAIYDPKETGNERQQATGSRTSQALHAAIGADPHAPF